jgi:hypothetical protein
MDKPGVLFLVLNKMDGRMERQFAFGEGNWQNVHKYMYKIESTINGHTTFP